MSYTYETQGFIHTQWNAACRDKLQVYEGIEGGKTPADPNPLDRGSIRIMGYILGVSGDNEKKLETAIVAYG